MNQEYTIPTQNIHDEDQQQEQLSQKNNFYCCNYSINIKNVNCPIKFPTRLLVMSVHLAYDISFLVQIGYRKIQHYSWDGNLLYQQQFEKLIASIFMIDSKTVILLLRSMNQETDEITQINLSSYQKYSIPFKTQLKLFMGMQIFKKSGTFCIKQQNQKPKKYCVSPSYTQRIKLTYYRYPIKSSLNSQIQTQPLYVCYLNASENESDKNLTIRKLNDQCVIGAYQQLISKDYKFDIFIYNPNHNVKYWKKYTFNSNLKKQVKAAYLSITNLWQYQPDIFYVSCQLYPQDLTTQISNQYKLKKMEKSYDFLWKYKNNSEKKVSQCGNQFHLVHFIGQELNLILARNIKQYIQKSRQARAKKKVIGYLGFQVQVVDHDYLKQLTQSLPKQQKIPMYFINPISKSQITQMQEFAILQRNQKPNGKNSRLASTPYDQFKFLEYNEDYTSQQDYKLNIKLKILRQLKYPPKMIVAFFMTQIMEKCDEDLIYYMTEMLYQDQNQLSNHSFN